MHVVKSAVGSSSFSFHWQKAMQFQIFSIRAMHLLKFRWNRRICMGTPHRLFLMPEMD
ncbi:hypothetical protein QG37_04154 [Candidozyma auris]|nr:hypothetical protein QG37_04154 [[Candida] auris]